MQLAERSATELVGLITRREVSPLELLDCCIERIAALNPSLNAIVAECFDRARKEAQAVGNRITRGETAGPLSGLPLAVKDLTATAGLATTFGSALYRNNVPESDDPVIAAARSAGAIVIGKTNTPEFGIGGTTSNRLHGTTRNPFDPSLTCGGSSGGSAVAVATGMSPLATGTDSGGSLRNPAAFCGVVGIRTTPGVLPSPSRRHAWSPMGVVGPMARSVADASLLLSAMARAERRDPMSFPIDIAAFDAVPPANLKRLRVAVSPDLGFARVANSVREDFATKMAKLAPNFGSCSPLDPKMESAERVCWILRCLYVLSTHQERSQQHSDALEEKLLGNLKAARALSASDIAWAHAEQARLCQQFSAIFDTFDVLITPAASVSPFPAELAYPASIDGVPLAHYAEWLGITYGVTLVGHPALAMPCGTDRQGLPFGIQLIGRRHGDLDLLSVGLGLEICTGNDAEVGRTRWTFG